MGWETGGGECCLFVRARRWEIERSGDSGSEWYDIGPIGRKVMWQRGLAGRKRERHLAGSINFGFYY